MLNKIFIQNFALIDTLELDLKKGLQVITGETGAGKSIILGALRLILGERADTKSIQVSDKKSIVEAEFDLSNKFKVFFETHNLDFSPETIIRREILPSGKSRAFINDQPVTLEVLRETTKQLIDIHSQFQTENLFTETYQFDIIDRLSDNRETLAQYQEEFSKYKQLHSKLEQLKQQQAEGNKEADYKDFLLSELQEIYLDEINWEQIQIQLGMQENAENISENLAVVLTRIDQEEVGVLDQFSEIRNRLSKVAELSHHFYKLKERFESIFLEIKDFIFDIQNESEKIEVNPQLLADLNEKVNRVNALFLKHQVKDIESLIAIREKITQEQQNYTNIEGDIAETEKEIQSRSENLSQLSASLSSNRKKGIVVFIKETETLLKQLGLEKAKIQVELLPTETFSLYGSESIEILFQANSGFPLKPIHTAISGGERSRVMLAIKKIMADHSELPTLILDEIDTGVSGRIAGEIGKVMQTMAKNMQLIVITHLAQVAAKGNNNYKVVKTDIDGRTQSTILSLNEKEKLNEIAQLLSGAELTQAALNQARELMKN